MAYSSEESTQAALIEATVRLADESGTAVTADFLARYLEDTLPEFVATLQPDELLGMVRAHIELAGEREPGEAAVRVFTPAEDSDGWSTGRTVVQCVSEDMPFLVDSVEGALVSLGRRIHVAVHPVIDAPHNPAANDRHDVPESWIHLEINRATEESAAQIADAVKLALDDVRATVDAWPAMVAKARQAASEAGESATGENSGEAALAGSMAGEGRALMEWMIEGHITFLGYIFMREEGHSLVPEPGSGLGLLASGEADAVEIPGRTADSQGDVVITKAEERSRVHRRSHMDVIAIRGEGGEHRFLGLFASTAYSASVVDIPVIRDKVRAVFELADIPADSHYGRDLLQTLEYYPRDLMFQTSAPDIHHTAKSVLHLSERHATRLFIQEDPYGRFLSAMVFTPRDLYNTRVRVTTERILREAWAADDVEYTTHVSNSTLASLYYVLRGKNLRIGDVHVEDVEQKIADAARSWEDEFETALSQEVGVAESTRLTDAGYRFTEAYKETFSPKIAVMDLKAIDSLDSVTLNLYEADAGDGRRLKLYTRERPSLTDIMPVFTNMGLVVTDEHPYTVTGTAGDVDVVDFGVTTPDASMWKEEGVRERFHEAFLRALSGRTESDHYDKLILGAQMRWQDVVVLRAYGAYLRQAGIQHSSAFVAETLVDNPDIARLLVELFHARFNPRLVGDGPAASEDRLSQVADADAAVTAALADVSSLDQERILRFFQEAIQATVRTNAFGSDGETQPEVLAFKIQPRALNFLPLPRPMWELWVYSPRVEGVHLRFGSVARGGLRWSDRREDFRTEVLGLVKAQMVKNAVIVPTGSKGGFFPKRLPDPSVDRNAWAEEGRGAYVDFIDALLSVTDNLVEGEAVTPEGVIRHDEPDTYLVVAADKGTARFSDTANKVAQDREFWLDDAFASGGSSGYDHKAMGITARGAWESVRAHFRELDVDVQTDEVTVVGIGDMSGDVFGNGLLRSESVKLVGAFDHRHVFVDPNPDPKASFAERQRLFEMAGSSWDDYSKELISEGGGVWPRSAKSITLSDQAREVLGLDESEATLTPAELIRAVLKAPVDLLWNGGIGTYVKGEAESQADVGDKANDSIRINGSDLRVRVVGEGGNLGFTQLGRIEAALGGVLINTDAIDNSAGVDTSDHEVNIKIILSDLVRQGKMTLAERNELLESMTDDVAEDVLRTNYEQNILIINSRTQDNFMVTLHSRLMHWLEENADLDRAVEFLPSDADLLARVESSGRGLTPPEFAVLVAYTKIAIKNALVDSTLPDEPWIEATLRDYFPAGMQNAVGDHLADHPLRREIIANAVANSVVNRGGITFVLRAIEETGAGLVDICRAFVVSREIFDLRSYVEAVEELDNKVSTKIQSFMYIRFRRLLNRATRWLLQSKIDLTDSGEVIERFRAATDRWGRNMGPWLRREDLERHDELVQRLVDDGVGSELATWSASLLDAFSLLDVVVISERSGESLDSVMTAYAGVADHIDMDSLLSAIAHLPEETMWETMARSSIRFDAYGVIATMTSQAIEESEATGASGGGDQRVDAFFSKRETALAAFESIMDEVDQMDQPSLAAMSVAIRTLRGLI